MVAPVLQDPAKMGRLVFIGGLDLIGENNNFVLPVAGHVSGRCVIEHFQVG